MAAPTVDQKILDKMYSLLKKERSVKELSEKCRVSRSTVYRYLHLIKSSGANLNGTLSRPTKYQITD